MSSVKTNRSRFLYRVIFCLPKQNLERKKKEAIVEWERKTNDIVKSPSSLADIIGWLMTKDRTSDIARKKSKKVLEKQKFFEIA